MENKIANILGLEKYNDRWILNVYVDGTGKTIDYTDEVKEIAKLLFNN